MWKTVYKASFSQLKLTGELRGSLATDGDLSERFSRRRAMFSSRRAPIRSCSCEMVLAAVLLEIWGSGERLLAGAGPRGSNNSACSRSTSRRFDANSPSRLRRLLRTSCIFLRWKKNAELLDESGNNSLHSEKFGRIHCWVQSNVRIIFCEIKILCYMLR